MKFKFGDKVQVIEGAFYIGAKGIVVYHSKSDDMFTVRLDHMITRDFYATSLKKLAKGKK